MLFAIITLLSALSIAGVAAWYSIIGLSALFGAAVGPVILMASTLEVGKLVSASWLYRNWHIAPKVLKIYLTVAVLGLMFITSMGIFGFLSRAHLEQAGSATEAQMKVERVDERISRIEGRILVTKDKIKRLQTTDVNHNNTNISRSIDQQIERRDSAWDRVKNSIEQEQAQISALRTQLDKDIQVQQDRLESAKERVREDTAIKQEAIKRLELQLAQLDADVKAYTDKGIEKRNWGQAIDWIKRGKELRVKQKPERDIITNKIKVVEREIAEIRKNEIAVAVIVQEEIKILRDALAASIAPFQSKIDGYRSNAQSEIDKANAEIKDLQDRLGTKADDTEVAIQALEVQIDEYFVNVDTLKAERFSLSNDVRSLEAEVGPLKYVAELVYGNDLQNNLDKAVRFVILILIFVFDPLAVCMIIAANISLIRVFGKDDDNVTIPTVLKGFVEKQEKDEVIDEFFKEEFEPSVDTVAVKKKIVNEERITDYGGLNGKIDIVHDAGNLGITESQQEEDTVSLYNISDVGITENLEIREIPVEVEKIIIKEVPVEVIIEKEIIKEVEKIVEVPVDRIIEIPAEELTKEEIIIGNKIHEDVPVRKKRKITPAKKKIVNPDKFSSASLQRPDGSTLELKRKPDGIDKVQGSVTDASDPGVLTKRDRIQREISKKTGQKRLDPWTGNVRWQKAKYDQDNEDPNKK